MCACIVRVCVCVLYSIKAESCHRQCSGHHRHKCIFCSNAQEPQSFSLNSSQDSDVYKDSTLNINENGVFHSVSRGTKTDHACNGAEKKPRNNQEVI